ncbi:hypothetical protein [Streptomyces sp. NPDC001743]|uniref:hypothetical protein n=1 Tax=Streptomyces sp. NPDC001743 TaxID=3154397 RepID=UPI00331BA77A
MGLIAWAIAPGPGRAGLGLTWALTVGIGLPIMVVIGLLAWLAGAIHWITGLMVTPALVVLVAGLFSGEKV